MQYGNILIWRNSYTVYKKAMFDIGSIFGGSLGGAIFSYLFKIWQNNQSHINKRVSAQVDEVVAEVRELDKVSREYWITNWNDKAVKTLEVEINVRIHRIGALISVLHHDGWIFEGFDVSDCYQKLFELATGGEYQVKKRKKDLLKAESVGEASTNLIVALRHARRNAG